MSLASDVFSFGVVLWELLTWKAPLIHLPSELAPELRPVQKFERKETERKGQLSVSWFDRRVTIVAMCM